MITTVVVGLALVVVVGLVMALRKSGKDAVRADSAEEALKDVARVNAPITDADREFVRGKYQRD